MSDPLREERERHAAWFRDVYQANLSIWFENPHDATLSAWRAGYREAIDACCALGWKTPGWPDLRAKVLAREGEKAHAVEVDVDTDSRSSGPLDTGAVEQGVALGMSAYRLYLRSEEPDLVRRALLNAAYIIHALSDDLDAVANCVLHDIADALAPGMSAWISAQERMPKPGELVLVYLPGDDYSAEYRWADVLCKDGRWFECADDQITHWMPFPPAPHAKPEGGPVIDVAEAARQDQK